MSDSPSVTKRLKIGALKVYATVVLGEDGLPRELFLTGSKVGSFERGMLGAFADMANLALKKGVPLRTVIDQMKGTQFSPEGATGSKEFPFVKSLLDYLGRWIEARFLKKEMLKSEVGRRE